MAAVHIQYNDGEFDEVSSTKTAGSCRNHRRRRVWDLGAGGDRGWSRRTLILKFRGARAGAATLSLLNFSDAHCHRCLRLHAPRQNAPRWGANGSVEAGGVDSDMLELIFMKAAKPRELAPGRQFVEGEVMKSVFLLTEGELCLKKKGENGVSKPTGISRYKGALLGELSLLLGYPASVSIEVSPKYSGASVLELPQEQLLSMLSSDPHLAGGFFRLLGATLGERITGRRPTCARQPLPRPRRRPRRSLPCCPVHSIVAWRR